MMQGLNGFASSPCKLNFTFRYNKAILQIKKFLYIYTGKIKE